MREICFKGKTLNGDWRYGYYVCQYNRHLIVPMERKESEDIFEQYSVEPKNVSLCTGLKDINGTRLFENDRIRVNEEALEGVIAFGEHTSGSRTEIGFYIRWLGDPMITGWLRSDLLYWIQNDSCAVIGNIFDEPDKS